MSPARATLDRTRPPEAGSARPFSFPEFEHRRLAAGLDLYVAPIRRAPLVHLRLLGPAGGQLDPRGKSGLAALTAALVDEGTTARSSVEIATSAERLGGYLSSSAGWDSAEIAIGMLAQDLSAGWELLAEVAGDPVFPESEVERLKALTAAELRRRRAQPAALGAECMAAALYGQDRYGTPLLGTPAGVEALERSDVVEFHASHHHGNPMTVIAVGDLDPEGLAERAHRDLARLATDRSASPPPAAPASPSTHRVFLVDRPEAPQTELRIAQVGIARSHPDFLVAAVLNSLLGGKFMSRINLNLRERHGFTYGASSSFAKRLGPGPFTVSTALANEVVGAATREVLGELRRVCEEPVDEDELAETTSYLQGVFPYTLQTLDGIAARLEDLAVHSLPLDHYDTFAARLAAVTPADVLRVAREALAPESLTIVAVGPRESLEPQLGEIGEPRHWAPDSA